MYVSSNNSDSSKNQQEAKIKKMNRNRSRSFKLMNSNVKCLICYSVACELLFFQGTKEIFVWGEWVWLKLKKQTLYCNSYLVEW